ncbi:MAG: lmo0937 family membrane protein [Planctomycetes bacterium]|nr:lmo0937 family membrane protein [Planctomycetota bacterium]
MLETIAIILILLWAVGMISSYTMGGVIHLLLLVALVVILFRVLRGRPAV